MYRELHIFPKDKILIVAPHADDEIIGCCGLLCEYNCQCDVLLLTDGRFGRAKDSSLSEEEIIQVRKNEFKNVMSLCKVNNYFMLSLPDKSVKLNSSTIEKFKIHNYSIVFVPNRYEWHPDHYEAFRIFKKMIFQKNKNAQLIEYEVWSPLRNPNLFLDISDTWNRKKELLSVYLSQNENIDYIQMCYGLNSYRGAETHRLLCEAFYSENVEKRNKREERFLHLPQWIQRVVRFAHKTLK